MTQQKLFKKQLKKVTVMNGKERKFMLENTLRINQNLKRNSIIFMLRIFLKVSLMPILKNSFLLMDLSEAL